MTARAVRSRAAATDHHSNRIHGEATAEYRSAEAETYQARTLARHIRATLQGDDKKLWDQVSAEYRRVTGRTSTIGLISALAALALDDLCRMPDVR